MNVECRWSNVGQSSMNVLMQVLPSMPKGEIVGKFSGQNAVNACH
jgi:hypothetical protein